MQEGKTPAIFRAVHAGSSMTCSHCACQCNGTPAQLYFWLSPALSRNHFTAAPPLMRSTREGAESSCCNTTSRLFTPALSRHLTKQRNNAHDLRECTASSQPGSTALLPVGVLQRWDLGCAAAPGSAPARWSWHRGLQLLTPVRANACAASGSSSTPAACSDITTRPLKTPLAGCSSC